MESLTKQLEVEKKLRKLIEKENPKFGILDQTEINEISSKLSSLKKKYKV